MLKATFEDFADQNPMYRVKFNNPYVRLIFDHVLSNSTFIAAMTLASRSGSSGS